MLTVSLVDAEQMAFELADDPSRLLRRLCQARGALPDGARRLFDGWSFDYEGQRLVSGCGRFALCWRVRRDPDAPAGPDNPQLPGGVVSLERD